MVLERTVPKKLFILLLCAHFARPKTCFAPVVCSDGDDSFPEWMHIDSDSCSAPSQLHRPQFLREKHKTTSSVSYGKSEKGEKGEPGPKGETGPTGAIGPPGRIGYPGPQGPIGRPGTPINGIDGLDGSKGDRGLPGPSGRTGLPGLTGLRGATGVPGDKGSDGMTGIKGDKGDKGEGEKLNQTILDGLQADVKELKTKMEEMSENLLDVNERYSNSERENCSVKYNSRCFIPVLYPNMSFKKGQKKCAEMGGNLANIYSQEHMDTILKYFYKNWKTGRRRRFYLGMTLNHQSMIIKLANGTDAPFIEWAPGYPSPKHNRANLVLHVTPAPSNKTITNETPDHYYKILCEIPSKT